MIEGLLEFLREKLRAEKNVSSVILFGSFARGDADLRSDVDLCIVMKDASKTAQEKISGIILDCEKKFDKNIQVVFSDEKLSSLERILAENILREGKAILGKIPQVSVQRLELQPYNLIKYDLGQLTQPEKMVIKRELYGQRSSKKHKGKVYYSEKKGLITEVGAERIGIASIMVPQAKSAIIEKFLESHRAKIRKIGIWVSKE